MTLFFFFFFYRRIGMILGIKIKFNFKNTWHKNKDQLKFNLDF